MSPLLLLPPLEQQPRPQASLTWARTPWVPPSEMHAMGYAMILYPTTVLFRVVRSIQLALVDLREGRPLSVEHSVDMQEFESIVRMQDWADIENRLMYEEHGDGLIDRIKEAVTGNGRKAVNE